MTKREVLNKFVPESSLNYCLALWSPGSFLLKIKNKRSSKLGDYKYDPRSRTHYISVNNDLNPYSFLITYLHEVAHYHVFSKHGRKVKPHGQEWKNEFKRLLLPVLNNAVFPDDILRKIAGYIKNPKASSCNDHELTKALSKYDNEPAGMFLQDIPLGTNFSLGNRIFKKDTLRRTRFVCVEVKSGKRYLISKSAQVKVA